VSLFEVREAICYPVPSRGQIKKEVLGDRITNMRRLWLTCGCILPAIRRVQRWLWNYGCPPALSLIRVVL